MSLRRLLVTVVTLFCFLLPGATWAQERIHEPLRVRPRPRPVALTSVQLEDEQGNALRTFRVNGNTFVLGQQGRRYNIRLSNNTGARIEVAMSVDGRDVIHGRRSEGTLDRGYLVPPHGSVLIKGFRTSMSSVAAFRFSSPRDSFAGRHGHAHTVGVIDVVAYRERIEPVMVPRPRPHLSKKSRGADDRAAPPPPAERSATPKPRSESRRPPRMRDNRGNLGTEFGENIRSQIRETTFVRANRHQPNQRMRIRYDDAMGLEARGIVVIRPPVRPPPVRVVPPRFAQPPPPRPDERRFLRR